MRGTGEGIIEGTEVKVGLMAGAAENDRTEGELKLEPTELNGKETCLGLVGRPAFI